MAEDSLVQMLDEAMDRIDLLERERDGATARLRSMERALIELRDQISLFRSNEDPTPDNGPVPQVPRGEARQKTYATGASVRYQGETDAGIAAKGK